MDAFRKVSVATVWQIIGKGVTAASTLLILSFVSRTYGQSEVGIFTLALTYLGFFYFLVDFGINPHILPSLMQHDYKIWWQKLLGIRVLISLFLLPSVLLISFLIPGMDERFRMAVFIGMPTIIFYSVFISASALFQAKLNFHLSALLILSNTLVSFLIIILMIQNKQPVEYLMLGYLIGWITSFLVAFFVTRGIASFKPSFSISSLISIIKDVWPISTALLLNLLYFRVDSFILANLKNLSDVGIYNIAFQIFQNILVLPTFIMNGLYPLLITHFTKDKRRFFSLLYRSLFLILFLSLLITVFVILFSPVAIIIVAGEEFSGSADTLRTLSFGFPAYFLSGVLIWYLILLKRYKTMLILYLSGLILNIVLNFLFIPQYSYLAAAWTTVVVEYLILAFQIVILAKGGFLKG